MSIATSRTGSWISSPTSAELRDDSSQAFGDRVFAWQNWKLARLHARTAPCFVYHWSHVPPIAVPEEFADRSRGAYRWGRASVRLSKPRRIPLAVADARRRAYGHLAVACWTAFAVKGDPN